MAIGPTAGVSRVKAVLLASLLAALVVFFALEGGRWLSLAALQDHRDLLLAQTRSRYGSMLVGSALVYAVAVALGFPGATLLTLAMGLLFGRWVGTAVVVVAATTGATAAFLGARYLFADAVRRRMGPRLQRLAAGFERDAFSYLLFVRLVPIFPFWLMNLVPAFTPVRTRVFASATALGIVPGTFVLVNLGQSLGRIETASELLSAEVAWALALLGALALLPVLLRALRTRRSGETA